MPELTGRGPGPAMHRPAEHQPGAEPGPEVQIREVAAARRPQGEPEGGGVGVLVDDDGQPGPYRERVPQRIAVPLRKPGDAVQYPTPVVERARHRDAGPEHLPLPRAPAPYRRHRVRRRREHLVRRGAEVQRGGAARGDRAGQVDEHHRQLVAVQVQADRVPGVRHQPQHGARLAAGGGPVARLGRQALGPQPGGDLADGLWREPRALGEFEPADAALARHPQQIQHQRRVVAAQRRQVRAAITPVHRTIVAAACTMATALLKWQT